MVSFIHQASQKVVWQRALYQIMDKIFYLYRHCRKDNNEPFYIGIGNRLEDSFIYKRAFDNNRRSQIWLNYTKKHDFYVEILFETKNLEIILQKEIIKTNLLEFTKRPKLNYIKTEKYELNKQKERKEVLQFDMNNTFLKSYTSLTEAALENNLSIGKISLCCNKKRKSHGKFIWEFKKEN